MVRKRQVTIVTALLVLALGLVVFYWGYDKSWREELNQPHTFSEIHRTIGILVVADRSFEEQFGPRPEDWAREIVNGASRIFEQWIGLRLVICGYQKWSYGALVDLDQLETTPKGICDVKLGLTSEKMYEDGEQLSGKADKDAVILAVRRLGPLHFLFAHELGHLFGADDKDESGLLMYHTDSEDRGDNLDPDTWHILVRNKFCDFDKNRIFRKRS